MSRKPIEVTRQDRIYCLKASSDYHSEVCEKCKFYPNCDHMTQDDMTEVTIKDLELLEQEPFDDCVSRESILSIYDEWFATCNIADRKESPKKKIMALPPVTPTRKKGKWVCKFHGFPPEPSTVCSICGFDRDFNFRILKKINYCPNCGAKMESEVKE